MLGIQGLYQADPFDQVAQSTQDLTNWHPKAPDLTPPDTFCTRKEAVSFGNSYGRKLRYDENISAIGSAKVTVVDEPAEESLVDMMVQQSVVKDNFKMKEEIRKYKELCLKQQNEIASQKRRLDSNLQKISQQLLVLQKSLQRKEKTFSRTLRRKNKTISRQQELINDLLEKTVDTPSDDICHEDSDSGVVFSEAEVSQQRVNRSVSGVIKTFGVKGLRQDILSFRSTEDLATHQREPKSDPKPSPPIHNCDYPNSTPNDQNTEPNTLPYEPKIVINQPKSDPQTAPSEPSKRVFLNHRSVTRLKDIKYKRISKTKSKSMEELRDKLRDSPFLERESPRYSHA